MGTQKFRGHDNIQPSSLEFAGSIAGKKKKKKKRRRRRRTILLNMNGVFMIVTCNLKCFLFKNLLK